MRFLAPIFLLLGLLVSPALAQDLTDEQSDEAVAFAANNTRFVLYHEFGHLVIAQFGLPILGKEEDAADNIASVILLGERSEEYDDILIDAADGWYLSDISNTADFEDADFYDSHSLDIQRSYQIVCLMAGQSMETFGEFAAEYGLDEARIDLCGVDYDQLENSWAIINEAFIDPERGKGYTARIVYDEPTPRNGTFRYHHKELRHVGRIAAALCRYAAPKIRFSAPHHAMRRMPFMIRKCQKL